MYKILVSDSLAKEGLEVFKQVSQEFQVDVKVGLKPEELKAIIGEYDALAVRSATKVTDALMAEAKKMKVIGRAGIGVDNVDVPAATKRGIVVMNTPEGNVVTTAEHTIAMMMALTRKIPQATASMKAGKWDKKSFEGREVFNKTLGLVGLGNIGKVVADRARGLRMKVIAFDPFIDQHGAAKVGAELVTLEELYRRADYITVHTPMNEETKNLISDNAFELMKKNVFILNCARGGIIDEAALLRALDGGKVAGAALDVFVEEPPKAGDKLVAHDKVILTPHLGASTEEAQVNVSIAVAEQIIEFLRSGSARNAVNLPRVAQADLDVIGPYMTLAERAGSFVAQLYGGQISGQGDLQSVQIEYDGEIAEYNTGPLTSAVVKAVLGHQLGDTINYVNAPLVAKERGIRVLEQKSLSAKDYASSVTVRMQGAKDTSEVTVTLFAKGDARIVRINKMACEVLPEGYILILQNRDKPGVVGHVGSILGKANINIARMGLGRNRDTGEAMQALNLDNPVPAEVLEQIGKSDNMLSAKLVRLG